MQQLRYVKTNAWPDIRGDMGWLSYYDIQVFTWIYDRNIFSNWLSANITGKWHMEAHWWFVFEQEEDSKKFVDHFSMWQRIEPLVRSYKHIVHISSIGATEQAFWDVIYEWCADQCKSDWGIDVNIYTSIKEMDFNFASKDDALLFKLTWS